MNFTSARPRRGLFRGVMPGRNGHPWSHPKRQRSDPGEINSSLIAETISVAPRISADDTPDGSA